VKLFLSEPLAAGLLVNSEQHTVGVPRHNPIACQAAAGLVKVIILISIGNKKRTGFTLPKETKSRTSISD